MSRYIDYDAIDYRNDKMHDKSSDFIDGVYYMAERIEEAPSIDLADYVPKDFHDKTCEAMAQRHAEEIADMVRVVRCKDCIVFRTHGKNTDICPMWHNTHIDPYRDFCSRGKRREP